jgi:hypothetical protein
VTAREKAHALLDQLPDSEIGPVVDFIASRKVSGAVDEWGDLAEMTDAAAAETMRHLDEEERAQRGETIGEAWKR